jgi:hypothetical protein
VNHVSLDEVEADDEPSSAAATEWHPVIDGTASMARAARATRLRTDMDSASFGIRGTGAAGAGEGRTSKGRTI